MKLSVSLRRILAYTVDIVLLFLALAPAATLVERLLGLAPQTPGQVWVAIVLSFSIPAWTYFVLCDSSRSGATLGKRIFGLHTTRRDGGRLNFLKALGRTAVKLLPWEMAHIFGFAIADQVGPVVQLIGLIAANVLTLVYLIICLATGGRRSLHDLLAATIVRDVG
jgi:uncharacterized RDD family membrane protein YckC